MSALSRYGIAELVIRRLNGDRPDATSTPEIESLYPVIDQLANVQIKVLHFNETLPQGDTVPDGTVIASYVLPVKSYKSNWSMVELPVLPVRLPRLQGFRQITHVWYEDGELQGDELCQFIPMPGDAFYSVGKLPVISNMMGQVGYKQEGFGIIFTENLANDKDCLVEVKMLGLSLDAKDKDGNEVYSDFTPLPITPEMQGAIIEQLVEMYGGKVKPHNPDTDIIEPAKRNA